MLGMLRKAIVLGILVVLIITGCSLFSGGNAYRQTVQAQWTSLQLQNLEFHKNTLSICKSNQSTIDKLQKIKLMAVERRSQISAFQTLLRSVAVPNEYRVFHDTLLTALGDNAAYYNCVIEVCGQPNKATFGTLMTVAQSAKEKYAFCSRHMTGLGASLPEDIFLAVGDALSVVIREKPQTGQVAFSNPSRVPTYPIPRDYDPYVASMQSIINRYGASRDSLQLFCDWVRGNRSSSCTFRNDLVASLNIRRNLRQEASSLTPSPGYEVNHREFLVVLDEAERATALAIEYVDNCEQWKWDEFQRVSGKISRKMPGIASAYGVRW